MQQKALVVIDIQNDITKNYKDIIDNVNKVIDWAVESGIYVIYIKHENISEKTRTFKHGTFGAELVPDLKIVSDNIFTKYKSSILTCEEFVEFISKNGIQHFYITGADAIACVKSSIYNLCKENYGVFALTDCITSYDKSKIPEMLEYYEDKGCQLILSNELLRI